MTIVTINVISRDAIARSFAGAMSGEEQGQFISFATPELLFKTLTPRRLDLLNAMTGAGPLAISEIARRLVIDVKRAREDVAALLECGVLERAENGFVVFPYDAFRLDLRSSET